MAPLFGVSTPADDHVIGHLGPLLALQKREPLTDIDYLDLDF